MPACQRETQMILSPEGKKGLPGREKGLTRKGKKDFHGGEKLPPEGKKGFPRKGKRLPRKEKLTFPRKGVKKRPANSADPG
jgi:hypothetical protein